MSDPTQRGIRDLFNTGLHAQAGRQPEEFYAGGERSGLAVTNPNEREGARSIVDEILEQAARNGPTAPPEAPRNDPFRGSGNTLGSDDTPSTSIHDSLPVMGGDADEEPVTRHLTFWRNGFSIEDGPLLSFDEPRNRELLEAIQAGRAPPALFNVRYNQPLQLEVAQRTNEEYKPPPKRPMQAFEGSGNRLGSPAQEAGVMPGGLPDTPVDAPPSAPSFSVDESKPTTSVQVRLGDGARIVAKVNLTHTVGDLRNFVAAARPDVRAFVLQTTFPNKELGELGQTVEEAKLQNAVIVQRFT